MAPKFADNQQNASEADLQLRNPLDYAEGRFRGGTEQTTASEAAIQQTPWAPVPEFAGADKGARQITASEAPISTVPMHGWESYPTRPNSSERSIKQSQ